ncbi:MAG: beta-ribofuranosylaminobenzene 5'-phosphate synthase [Archaeoglobaceae archaeon]|nr:beta-ribofuranosylaminobenzene 5'-phosphate synthase [Archaeoglobaceae archaeon]
MRIRTGSRIHITLIDMNGSIGRVDGSVGLTINEPYVEIKAFKSDEVLIKGFSENLERFLSTSRKFKDFFGKGIEIHVISDYRPHVGLGSGTQIALSVGKAYSEIHGLNLSVMEIARIAGRGGTSGIGVSAFEFGGFLVDGGHSWVEKRDFMPSSISKARPAPLISRLDFPDWKIVVAIPKLVGAHGLGEVELFKKGCPVSIEEVRELCHLILMKIMPAVVEKDLDSFLEGIRRVQKIGFKRVEVERYGSLMKELLNMFPFGMSSTGPSVYTVTDTNSRELAREVEEYFNEKNIECDIFITKGRNRGAEVGV